jgi:hypothetical protein
LRTQHGGDRSSSFLSPCAGSAKPKRAGLVIAYGVVLPLGFAAPGAYRLQESDTYINFSTSIETFLLKKAGGLTVEDGKYMVGIKRSQ